MGYDAFGHTDAAAEDATARDAAFGDAMVADGATGDATVTDAGDGGTIPSITTESALRFGGAGEDRAHSGAVDGAGNVYVTGSFTDVVDFGGGPLASNGSEDFYAFSITPDGAHRWSVAAGAAGTDHGNRVVVTASGDTYVAGLFEGTADFGGMPLASLGGDDVFTIAITSGVVRWARRYGGADDHLSAGGVALMPGEDIVLASEFRGSQVHETATLASAGGSDVFVTRLGRDATERWAVSLGGSGQQRAVDAESDGAGGVVVALEFDGTLDLAVGSLTNAGVQNGAVVALDDTGTVRWARAIGGAGMVEIKNIEVGPDGRLYVCGAFDGDVDLGGATAVSAGGATDGFLAVWEPDGTRAFGMTVGGTGEDAVRDIAVDGGGRVFIAGLFEGTVDFGGGPLTSAGGVDVFLIVAEREGAHLRSYRYGGPGAEGVDDILFDGAGDLVLVGRHSEGADFGTGPLPSAGGLDISVVRLRVR